MRSAISTHWTTRALVTKVFFDFIEIGHVRAFGLYPTLDCDSEGASWHSPTLRRNRGMSWSAVICAWEWSHGGKILGWS